MGKIDPKQLVTTIRKKRGNVAAAARALGVSRMAIQKRVVKSKQLKAILEECRETKKDHAESALDKAVRKGEGWAVCFFLKTQAKDRGYVERTENEQIGDVTTVVKILGPGMKMSDLDAPT